MLFSLSSPSAQEQETQPLSPHHYAQLLTRELAAVEQRFNMTNDPDLIEACIFERAALYARLRGLLNQERMAKETK